MFVFDISCQAAPVEKIAVEPAGAFVIIDLEQCSRSGGAVRRARKILESSTKDLARSLTYGYATFEQQVSGASAGVNAEDDGHDAAMEAFRVAIAPMVESGKFSPDPGKGVSDADLAALRSADTRSPLLFEASGRETFQAELTAYGIAATLDSALGGLDGRTVAIEGFSDSSISLISEITKMGGKVTTIGTSAGTATSSVGFIADTLTHGLAEFGPAVVNELGVEAQNAWSIWGADVDALVPSTKMGVVSHGVADNIAANVIVPGTTLPITAKGLAHLRRAGKAAYPDFVALGGPVVGSVSAEGATTESVRADVASAIAAVVADIKGHEDGPLLAGCYRAESFLLTWQDKLPFGRPLA